MITGNKIYLSIETNGLDLDKFEIIEVAVLKIDKLSNKHLFHRLIKPLTPLSSSVEQVTGLSNAVLNQQKTFEQIKNEIINFIDNQEIVLHNQSFVLAFLNKQLGNPITNNVVDLMKIFNTKFPNESATLDFITTKLNLKIDTGFTSSLNEVFLLPRIYEKLNEI